MHRHGGGLGELSGLSRQPYIYEIADDASGLLRMRQQPIISFPPIFDGTLVTVRDLGNCWAICTYPSLH